MISEGQCRHATPSETHSLPTNSHTTGTYPVAVTVCTASTRWSIGLQTASGDGNAECASPKGPGRANFVFFHHNWIVAD